jgi:hypothetical protein
MNRREFSIAALPSSILLAGCDTDQKPSHTATLLNNSGVQEALKALESVIGDLEGEVDNFNTMNWREVVPEVEGAASGVRTAFEDLRRALGTPDS